MASFPRKPIYPPLPESVFIDDPPDLTPEAVLQHARIQAHAERYLRGNQLYIHSARLRGPFVTNPWKAPDSIGERFAPKEKGKENEPKNAGKKKKVTISETPHKSTQTSPVAAPPQKEDSGDEHIEVSVRVRKRRGAGSETARMAREKEKAVDQPTPLPGLPPIPTPSTAKPKKRKRAPLKVASPDRHHNIPLKEHGEAPVVPDAQEEERTAPGRKRVRVDFDAVSPAVTGTRKAPVRETRVVRPISPPRTISARPVEEYDGDTIVLSQRLPPPVKKKAPPKALPLKVSTPASTDTGLPPPSENVETPTDLVPAKVSPPNRTESQAKAAEGIRESVVVSFIEEQLHMEVVEEEEAAPPPPPPPPHEQNTEEKLNESESPASHRLPDLEPPDLRPDEDKARPALHPDPKTPFQSTQSALLSAQRKFFEAMADSPLQDTPPAPRDTSDDSFALPLPLPVSQASKKHISPPKSSRTKSGPGIYDDFNLGSDTDSDDDELVSSRRPSPKNKRQRPGIATYTQFTPFSKRLRKSTSPAHQETPMLSRPQYASTGIPQSTAENPPETPAPTVDVVTTPHPPQSTASTTLPFTTTPRPASGLPDTVADTPSFQRHVEGDTVADTPANASNTMNDTVADTPAQRVSAPEITPYSEPTPFASFRSPDGETRSGDEAQELVKEVAGFMADSWDEGGGGDESTMSILSTPGKLWGGKRARKVGRVLWG